MAKLDRKFMRVFGISATVGETGVFGSFAAGSPAYSTDPEVIQALSNWIGGWYSAVVGENSPCIQDMNAAFYVLAYQISSIQEMGIPEWSALQTYYIGSKVNVAGSVYTSLVNTNLNNAVTDITKWKPPGVATVRTVTTTDTVLQTDQIIFLNPSGGTFVETLPILAATPLGTEFALLNIHASNLVSLKGNGSELINGFNVWYIQPGESATVVKGASAWFVKNANQVPIGVPLPYTSNTVPAGYLLCDGSAVSRTSYARLFSIIGITAGQGDNSTTFNIPDYRGYFHRGTDPTPVRDPGPRTAMATGGNTGTTVNTVEAQDIIAHAHTINTINGYGGSGTTNVAGAGAPNIGPIAGNAAGGSETRPINASVTYIIKY